MNSIPLKFRDFTVHLFPGLIYLTAFILYSNEARQFLVTEKVLGSILLFISSYLVGFIFSAACDNTVRKIIRSIPKFKDPLKGIFTSEQANQNRLFGHAYTLLCSELGKDIVDNEINARLVYYCFRRQEVAGDSPATLTADRALSLENLTINLIPAFISLSFSLLLQQEFFLGVFCLMCAAVMPFKNISYRKWFMRVVLSSYIALKKQEAAN